MNIDTVFGKRLHLLLIVQLKTRRIVTWRLTEHPTREFVRQQIIEFTYDLPEAVTLIHDNGPQFTSIDFSQYNIKAVDTSVEAPNMNVFVERLIGSVRREALDHFLLFSEKQVREIISEYVDYYNTQRPHQGIHRIPQRSERSGSSMLVPFPSECRESKVKYPPLGAEREALPLLSRACPGELIPFIPECGDIPAVGRIQKKSVLWGLHHHYFKDSA